MATKNSSIGLELAHFNAFKEHWDVYHNNARSMDILAARGLLQVSTAFEHAIGYSADLKVVSEDTHDLSDGSDAKLCTARLHGGDIYPKYGAAVTNIHGKTGDLRVQVLEPRSGNIHWLVIPYSAYGHIGRSSNIELPFSMSGKPMRNNHWWRYEVQDWMELCNLTGADARELNALRSVVEDMRNDPENYEDFDVCEVEYQISELLEGAGILGYNDYYYRVMHG
jgi:hypothetical protein